MLQLYISQKSLYLFTSKPTSISIVHFQAFLMPKTKMMLVDIKNQMFVNAFVDKQMYCLHQLCINTTVMHEHINDSTIKG